MSANDADFGAGDIVNDIQPRAGGIEEIADMIDADIEWLDTEAHAAVIQDVETGP